MRRILKILLCISIIAVINGQLSISEAQQIETGYKYWDGAILYTATKSYNGSVELVGKDINGDDYSINLIWNETEGVYEVFSRNGAIALRIDEFAKVRLVFLDRVAHLLVFCNAKGVAAWTMDFFINADINGCTAMERRMEQMPPSEVISTYPINPTWLARYTKPELRLLRNEIYARHGWQFQSKDLREHFSQQSWYKPADNNDSIRLSNLERINLEMFKSEEATPDEYRRSMLTPEMFPGGLADDGRGPEEIDGELTYTITNEREFLAALGPDRTIVIAKNVHLNLSRVLENKSLFTDNPNRKWALSGSDYIGQIPLVVSEGETDGQQLDLININNLTIRGAGNSSIEVDPRYSYCIFFINCKHCRVENLTIGHTEFGYCSGGVIGVKRCENIEVSRCDLFGCGTYGFDVMESKALSVRDCIVHDCTYGIMDLSNSQNLTFTNCDFYRNKEYDLIEGRNCEGVSFTDCRFYRNNDDSYLFRFDTKFELIGCEIHHPTDKIGTIDMAKQTGKKNRFSPDTYPGELAPRNIGADGTSSEADAKN